MALPVSISLENSALSADAFFYRHQFDLREAFARDPLRFQ
jgi:hypothetical protein